jgi:hypothetical protein
MMAQELGLPRLLASLHRQHTGNVSIAQLAEVVQAPTGFDVGDGFDVKR